MCEEVIAEIQQGQLRGKKVASAAGGEYYSFQGIPYAKPPLGNLRFRPPEKPEPWEGIRDATKEYDISPSHHMFTRLYVGNEDCLFLNVYTSQWPVRRLKPVMVFFHGGGFMLGSGNTDLHGPDFLVAQDILLVTLNYRLGALGFLNMEGSDATTNNGLRDQVMALTWVKENIARFGGDPANVAIFGISAGGSSVHHLILSPSAEGLFHRAIAMSGTALLPICFISHDVSNKRSNRLAEVLGCTSDDPQQIVDYLRSVSAEDIVNAQNSAFSDLMKLRLVTCLFSPTEEIGDDRFLPDHPLNLMKEGKFNRVPLIMGVTSAEGKIMFFDGDAKDVPEMVENLESVLPWDLVSDIGTERSRQIAARLKQFYFSDPRKDTVAQFINMQSDLMFVYPMYTAVRLHVSSSDSPVYVYMFDHVMPPEMALFPSKTAASVPGAGHGDDMSYLFYISLKPNVFPLGSAEATVRSQMLRIWTQFAKTGTVSEETRELLWPPTTKDKFQYLKIGESLKIVTDLYKERMDFLDELYSFFKRPINGESEEN